MRADLLITDAQLFGHGCGDLRISDRRISDLAPHLSRKPGEMTVDAQGGVLLPGLIDHHLHLFATAAANASLNCGPPKVTNESELGAVLSAAKIEGGQWIRGIGFHESVCAQLDRHWLDRVGPDVPVRIQHRSGMLWVLNSRAIAELEERTNEAFPAGAERAADGTLTGRFYDLDQWLGARLPRKWPALHDISNQLARFGVTAVTDAGVNNGLEQWEALARAQSRGELRQRVGVMGSEELNDCDDSAKTPMWRGPLKVYLRESGLPDFDELCQRIGQSHAVHRPVAVHCVTRTELVFALAALRDVGAIPGDRIEHASVCDDDALAQLAQMQVTVVSQPHLITERGDRYLQDVAADDLPHLYRGAAFKAHGVPLAAGSDAPYGGIDPWAAMRSAMTRETLRGEVMSAAEALPAADALALFGGTLANPAAGLRPLANRASGGSLPLLGRVECALTGA